MRLARYAHGPFPAVVVACLVASGAADADASDGSGPTGPPVIEVVYPRDSQAIRAVDSTFILGSVTPASKLTINGTPVEVHEEGGFIGFLPVQPGEFVFKLNAVNDNGEAEAERIVTVAERPTVARGDSATILAAYQTPGVLRTVRPGDAIRLRFFGTPGMQAAAAIHPPGEPVLAMVPMLQAAPAWWRTGALPPYADTLPFQQPPVPTPPDTLPVDAASYVGMWRIPQGVPDSLNVSFLLVPTSAGDSSEMAVPADSVVMDTLDVEVTGGHELLRYLRHSGDSLTVRDSLCAVAHSPALLTRWTDSLPVVIELTDSVQTLRFGPRLGYLSTFQPAGVRMALIGYEGDWSICEPAPGHRAWVETEKTRRLPTGTWPPETRITAIRTEALPRATRIRFDTHERVPFIVREEIDPPSLLVTVFGVTTNTDWILPDPADEAVRQITWRQRQPGVYEARIVPRDDFIWGYEAAYDRGSLVVTLRLAPARHRHLTGVTVCVDPGHSADPGAIGPTGLEEKDANLAISLLLREQLEKRGARVVMTRTDDTDVPLYDRPAIARSAGADLFVSIHNNAVGDGVDPRRRNGSAVYYYHARNHEFARHVHRRLLRATRLDDYGLNHGNFAVTRPTQYPAILVECAFMIVPDQESLLRTKRFNKRIAEGIAEAVDDFVSKRARRR